MVRPCSAPYKVARCLCSPGAASKSPWHWLMFGSQASLGSLTGAMPCPEACRCWAAAQASMWCWVVTGSGVPAAHRLPACVSQCCPGKLGWLGLLEEAGSSLTSGRGGGSRQQPHKLGQKEATSLGQLCSLVRNRVFSLLQICHFSITSPRSVRKLYLRLPPSLWGHGQENTQYLDSTGCWSCSVKKPWSCRRVRG